MKLRVDWSTPVQLRDGSKENLVYTIDLQKLPTISGIYVFGRRWGGQFEALYVGKATRIRGRIKGQLNNLRLMQHLKTARNGRRVLLCAKVITRPGQQIAKCLTLIERALIRHFLAEGHDLVNKQGTRLRRHEIESVGKLPRRFIASPMYLERGRRE